MILDKIKNVTYIQFFLEIIAKYMESQKRRNDYEQN